MTQIELAEAVLKTVRASQGVHERKIKVEFIDSDRAVVDITKYNRYDFDAAELADTGSIFKEG